MKAVCIFMFVVGIMLLVHFWILINATAVLFQEGDNGYNIGMFLGRIVIALALLALFVWSLKQVR